MKILIMEKMIRDPDGTVRQVLNWLGLDPGRIAPLNRAGRNRTVHIRMPVLQALARRVNVLIRPPEPVRRLTRTAYGALQFRKSAPMTPDDAKAMRRLKADYAADNATLSRITGMDLSVWSNGT